MTGLYTILERCSLTGGLFSWSCKAGSYIVYLRREDAEERCRRLQRHSSRRRYCTWKVVSFDLICEQGDMGAWESNGT